MEGPRDVPQHEADEQDRERDRGQGDRHRHQDGRHRAGGRPLADADHRQGDDEHADQQREVSLHRHAHVELPARTESYLCYRVTAGPVERPGR